MSKENIPHSIKRQITPRSSASREERHYDRPTPHLFATSAPEFEGGEQSADDPAGAVQRTGRALKAKTQSPGQPEARSSGARIQMNDLEFCKAGLEEIVARAAPDRLVAKVNELMTKRMPVEPLHRQGLLAWAQAEQSKAEALIAGGKTVPSAGPSPGSRNAALLPLGRVRSPSHGASLAASCSLEFEQCLGLNTFSNQSDARRIDVNIRVAPHG
jgi:hypothetical protein